MNQALWKYWEEDFLIIGHRHRSPLDAANGIRGTALFEEMHTRSEKVKSLINWCADWSIEIERLIEKEVQPIPGYRGDICTWLPDGTAWVNGDAIDLISPDCARKFDLPYSSKLFTTLGGGFFHHHSIGLHQVSQVVKIEGLTVHHIANDYPSGPIPAEEMITQESIAEQIIGASLRAPVMLDKTPYRLLDRLLPLLEEGRFILSVECDDPSQVQECLKKMKKLR
jgi:hypothetical protein